MPNRQGLRDCRPQLHRRIQVPRRLPVKTLVRWERIVMDPLLWYLTKFRFGDCLNCCVKLTRSDAQVKSQIQRSRFREQIEQMCSLVRNSCVINIRIFFGVSSSADDGMRQRLGYGRDRSGLEQIEQKIWFNFIVKV
eukprot:scaffold32703_cov153-Amphora_coffeaeformis.AAC.5